MAGNTEKVPLLGDTQSFYATGVSGPLVGGGRYDALTTRVEAVEAPTFKGQVPEKDLDEGQNTRPPAVSAPPADLFAELPGYHGLGIHGMASALAACPATPSTQRDKAQNGTMQHRTPAYIARPRTAQQSTAYNAHWHGIDSTDLHGTAQNCSTLLNLSYIDHEARAHCTALRNHKHFHEIGAAHLRAYPSYSSAPS